jgi:prefoldin subunit 5
MTPDKEDDAALIARLRERTEELEKMLQDFSDRLRRMRERNRLAQQEVESFQKDLDELHEWLSEHL